MSGIKNLPLGLPQDGDGSDFNYQMGNLVHIRKRGPMLPIFWTHTRADSVWPTASKFITVTDFGKRHVLQSNITWNWRGGGSRCRIFHGFLTLRPISGISQTVSGGSGSFFLSFSFFFWGGGTGGGTLSSGGHTTPQFALNYRVCNRLYQIINT